MEQEKLCENCYYFQQHYYKSPRGRLMMICGDGHCTNGKLTKAVSRKNISKCRACEFWEPQEAQIAERRECVLNVIYEMQKRLEDIALLLKED